MAEYNIQMGQRNNENTEWDSHYPITKAENVKTENSTVAAELANKADKTYVDTLVQAVASGSPAGTFATIAALQADATANTAEGKKRIYLVAADGKWYHWNGSAWIAGGTYQSTGIAPDSINDEMISGDSEIVFKTPGKNLININDVTNGYYVNYLNGALIANATYCATGYIKILPSTEYTLSHGVDGHVLEQFSFYDENKIYVSGIAGQSSPYAFTSPANAHYVRLTIRISFLNENNQLEKGTLKTTYEPYITSVKISDLEKGKLTFVYLSPELQAYFSNKTIITVKQDGTGDYTNLRTALESITDASETNPYEVHIYPGTYDIMGYYTSAEIDSTSFIGLVKPDYVSLIGTGSNSEDVWIKGDLVDGAHSETTMARVSTLVRYGNGTLENIKITARNLRYAVHDDYNYPGAIAKTKNCKFYKYKSPVWNSYQQAYGEGCWSGTRHEYEDCYFYTDIAGYSYSFHNNVGFTKPSIHIFKNCEFDNEGSCIGIAFISLGSSQEDTIEMIGCRIKGQIKFDGDVCDFKLTGYGNDMVPYYFANTDDKQYVYNFQGEHKNVYNTSGSTITKGTPVKQSTCGIEPLATTDDQSVIFGIAFEDINPATSGVVRIGGYLHIADTNLSGLVNGDKIGIVNGVLAKVTSGDYIGVVVPPDTIKLKF